jgi:hypothetical protein
MAWKHRIEVMMVEASALAQRKYRDGLVMTTDALAASVRAAVSDTMTIRVPLEGTDAGIKLSNDAVVALDAVTHIAKEFLGRPHLIHDLPMPKDLDGCKKAISEAFKSKKVPKRGFVYLAWTAAPEVFYYVGLGGSDARLDLDKHGKLAWSLASAETLSLMFPERSDKRDLGDLEGSVMQLVRGVTGKLPIHNTDPVLAPEAEATLMHRNFGSMFLALCERVWKPYSR